MTSTALLAELPPEVESAPPLPIQAGFRAVVEHRPLLEAVRLAARIAPAKSSLAAAMCVLLEAKASSSSLHVRATDLHTIDVEYQLPARVRRQGQIAVSARRLCEYLEAVEGESGELLLAASPVRFYLHLVIGRYRARFATQPPDELPLMVRPDVAVEWCVDAQALKKLIGQTAFAALAKSSDRALGNVLIEVSDGRLVLVGADGYRLAQAAVDIDPPVIGGDVRALAPRAAAEELAVALARPGGNQVRVRVREDGGQLEVEADTFRMLVQCCQSAYPDYRPLLDGNSETCRATLAYEDLRRATNTQAAFCGHGERLEVYFAFPGEIEIKAGRDARVGDAGGSSARSDASVVVNADVIGRELSVPVDSRQFRDALATVASERIELVVTDQALVLTDGCGTQHAFVRHAV